MDKWLIVYSSMTGNTEKIAQSLAASWGEKSELVSLHQNPKCLGDGYPVVVVCYWLQRGEPNKLVQQFLQRLHDQYVILVQTHGCDTNSEHDITAFARAARYLPINCDVLGTFSVQGRINPRLLEQRHKVSADNPHAATERNKERWQRASVHPNEEDYARARDFALAMERKFALKMAYREKKRKMLTSLKK